MDNASDRRSYTSSPDTTCRKGITPMKGETTHLPLTKKTIITCVIINSEQEKKEIYVLLNSNSHYKPLINNGY